MRLSTLGRYALRAMVDLAQHEGQGPVLRQEIADRQELSSNYLAHLFARLGRAGLVKSVFGPGGGYVLARSAAEITAGDVLRAVEESLTPVYCVDCEQEEMCHRAEGCPTRPLWVRLGKQLAQTLDSITLADLCKQSYPTDGDTPQDRPVAWLAP
jgi:Rrf2 family cysteine metabolism transcriptional repressor